MFEFKELNERKKGFLLDDFLGCCVEYDSLSDLLANNNIVWFFGVFQQTGDFAGIFSNFETMFDRTSADCHQRSIKGREDCTFKSKKRRITDKVVLRDHPYCKTFNKWRVPKAADKEHIQCILSVEF